MRVFVCWVPLLGVGFGTMFAVDVWVWFGCMWVLVLLVLSCVLGFSDLVGFGLLVFRCFDGWF